MVAAELPAGGLWHAMYVEVSTRANCTGGETRDGLNELLEYLEALRCVCDAAFGFPEKGTASWSTNDH